MPGDATGGYDWGGLALVTAALGLVMGGRWPSGLQGPDSVLPWLLISGGVAALVPFVRYERGHPAPPMIDVRLLRPPAVSGRCS